ncbi:MAG: aldo/keto reductase [Phycisphaerae bacterium]
MTAPRTLSDAARSPVSRRAFLGAAAAAAVLPRAGFADAPPAAMPTRKLGKTGLDVPILEVGGTYRFTKRYVERALALGCNFFDTAASYVNGWSERNLGQALADLGARRKAIIVTKGHPDRPESLAAAVDASLERLRSDAIDIFYVHNLRDPAVLTDRAWRDAVAALKRRGKIRHFGFSCHNENLVALLRQAATAGTADVCMFKYNFRSFDDAELNRAIDAAAAAHVGLIAMKTQGSAISFSERVNPFLAQGVSKHQAVLKAVWKDDRIASAVSCMPSIQVLEHNAAAAGEKLSAIEDRLLRRLATATRRDYCPGGCGGCRRECESAGGSTLAIADTLRYLMYRQSYGQRAIARAKFHALPIAAREWTADQLRGATAACPRGLPVGELLRRSAELLA